MKLTRSTLVIGLAGLLVAGAAGAVVAAPGAPAAVDGNTLTAPAASPSTATSAAGDFGRFDPLLDDVLDELVADGTITAAQQTAITDALDEARTARREEAEARRTQMREFLADGVITQEEYDQLPEDSALRQLTTLMDDGQITLDELRELGRGMFGGRGGHGWGGGHGGRGGFGGGPFSDNATPEASPTTSS